MVIRFIGCTYLLDICITHVENEFHKVQVKTHSWVLPLQKWSFIVIRAILMLQIPILWLAWNILLWCDRGFPLTHFLRSEQNTLFIFGNMSHKIFKFSYAQRSRIFAKIYMLIPNFSLSSSQILNTILSKNLLNKRIIVQLSKLIDLQKLKSSKRYFQP